MILQVSELWSFYKYAMLFCPVTSRIVKILKNKKCSYKRRFQEIEEKSVVNSGVISDGRNSAYVFSVLLFGYVFISVLLVSMLYSTDLRGMS
jgi:hypothetical protein